MKKALLSVAALAILAGPAYGSGFQVFGSYWDIEDTDEAIGGGVAFAFPIFGDVVDLQLRGSYFEETEPNVFSDLEDVIDDPDRDFFDDDGIQVIPVELGLKFDLAPDGAPLTPYVGAGGAYYLLDTDVGEVDDELGWYALAGLAFGDGSGADFFVEALWRDVEGSVAVDPDRLDEIDDVEFEDEFDVDLSGIGANVGVVFRF